MKTSRLTPRRPYTWSSDSVEGSEGLKLAIQARDDCLAKSSRFRIKKAYYRIGRRAKASISRFI